MKRITWGSLFCFVWWSAVTTVVLVALSYVAMGMEVGTGAIYGASGMTLDGCRERWLNNFSWMHFALQGMMLWSYNLCRRREEELVYIEWSYDGCDQFVKCIELFFGFICLELLSYLIQFVGNAIYIAVTNWVSDVTVPNMLSLKFLAKKVNLLLIFWETGISALIISYFDRRNRRRRYNERKEKMRFEERRNTPKQSHNAPKPDIVFYDYPEIEFNGVVEEGIKKKKN